MLKVLFEDNHLLVLSKPAGLLTQPSGTDQPSLQEQAKLWLKKKYNKPGNVYLESIHRLDRAASGIVVFAKTSKAASRLAEAIRDKTVKKTYRALVSKTPQPVSGILEHYLIHDNYRAQVVDKKTPQAKHAKLCYKLMDSFEGTPQLEIELITGRYHQIRAQLAAIGCPILGDKKYGSKTPWKFRGIALHHARFEIFHPTTQQSLVFEDDPSRIWF